MLYGAALRRGAFLAGSLSRSLSEDRVVVDDLSSMSFLVALKEAHLRLPRRLHSNLGTLFNARKVVGSSLRFEELEILGRVCVLSSSSGVTPRKPGSAAGNDEKRSPCRCPKVGSVKSPLELAGSVRRELICISFVTTSRRC